jgi:hypothetical protein
MPGLSMYVFSGNLCDITGNFVYKVNVGTSGAEIGAAFGGNKVRLGNLI